MATRALSLALLALCSSCASSVQGALDGAPDAMVEASVAEASVVEASVAEAAVPDVTMPSCTTAADCAGLSAPAPVRFSTGYSCIAGRCTYEPESGRACQELATGCVRCAASPETQVCATAPCAAGDAIASSRVRIESSNCSRDFLSDVTSCFGGFVRLRDGALCTVSEAPTGAIRYVLSCGSCETVFMPRG